MNYRFIKASLLSVALSTGMASAAPHQVTVTADLEQQGPVINKDIYGQFAEHLGRGIYEGLWVGPDSSIPNTKGFRNDVIDALKEMSVPLVRWPGGCFADEYHWRDGIGAKNERPVKVNTHWGGVEETNAVGTHEFFDLAELLGAEVYINGNLGSGSVQEMAEWMEYMTSDKNSTLANLRRENGREDPWDIKYFGIGNESWGCGGHMEPDYYVDLYRQYATFLKTPPGKKPLLVGSGGHTEDTQWTDVLSKNIERNMDGISYHFYTLPTSEWETKGHATEFGKDMWFATLERTYRMDEYLQNNIAILDKNDPEGELGFYVDEWGTWYDAEEDREPGFLYQQNTLRDAVVTAINLNLFHKYAERVHMTNIAQMVNVLQAMILTDGPDMLKTPTYHVYDMYSVFQDATAIPVELDTSDYTMDDKALPAVTGSLAKSKDGSTYLALVNLDPENVAAITLDLEGDSNKTLKGEILTAKNITDKNTFEQKDVVAPKPFETKASNFQLPAKSIVVVKVN
ncbi:alpha-N-arabinofuranosidase [Salinimonas chungwhensis]|uniref:alpha-N-arabinofuranosidase n=1 Tax=Salinimonas chungwhensis TaxID=265425 RepID=UPI00036C7B79|nr:alpha-L-arabinofuranosidase C-terminal domain-containing protein [Salinimonas chungwhensis]